MMLVKLWHMWRAVVVALLLAATLAGPAVARSVFIVYDTSFSMDQRRNLPAFGASVLAATLDGRTGKDRLFTLTFGDYRAALEKIGSKDGLLLDASNVGLLTRQLGQPMYRSESMTDPVLQQRMVNGLNRRFATAQGGTPYGPIEVMLDAIARETKPGEEVHLIIVSDGGFDAAPSPEGVLTSMRTHRDRIKADVRVSFLQILPSGPSYKTQANKLRETVDEQGIRSGMLSVFNGDADNGSYEVDSGPALWAALRDIIARISATDQTELGRYVAYEGNNVRIDTPFSITRIISVSTSADAKPPVLKSVSFAGENSSVETAMQDADPEFPGLKFKGVTSQFRFVPALQPGQHQLEFDGPTPEDVFLLFDTNVVAALDIVDAGSGLAVPRDAQGRAELELGNSYQLQTVLSDPGSTLRTDFDALSPGTAFSVEILGGAAPVARTLNRDDANDRAVAEFSADTRGTFSATAQVRIPGFVSPKSAPLDFVVLDRALALTLSAERPAESCSACAPGELASSVTANDTGADVATFDIAVDGHAPGTVIVEMPDGAGLIDLIDRDGAIVPPGTLVLVAPGDVLSLTVRRKPIDAAFFATPRSGSFSLRAVPAGSATGAAVEISRTIRFVVPEARITLVSYAKGRPEDGPLDLSDVELRQGGIGADLKIEGTLMVPDAASVTVTPAGRGWFWKLDQSVSDYVITVSPKAGVLSLAWIEASAWLFGREVAAVVRYEDSQRLQTAEARVPIAFTITWGAFFLSLALNLLILLAVFYLLWVAIAILAVQRFPKHAVVEEVTPGDQHPGRKEMRGSNLLIYLSALLVPFKGFPKEKLEFRGLMFEAASGGVKLVLPKDKVPAWYLTSQGVTLAKLRELTPTLGRVHLQWADQLRDDHDRDHVLTMVKDRRKKI